MDTEEKLELLVDASVFAVTKSGDGYEVAEAFENTIEERLNVITDLSSSELLEYVGNIFENKNIAMLVRNVGEEDREFVAICVILAERLEPTDDVVRTALIVQQFRRGVPRSEGAPNAFLAVHGTQLTTLTRLFPRLVIYIWREDCDPCDAMRETFDELFATKPDGLELFAVYGPDYAKELTEAFDVFGGPTTLFIREGQVDSRLQGAHYRETVENELEHLREE